MVHKLICKNKPVFICGVIIISNAASIYINSYSVNFISLKAECFVAYCV